MPIINAKRILIKNFRRAADGATRRRPRTIVAGNTRLSDSRTLNFADDDSMDDECADDYLAPLRFQSTRLLRGKKRAHALQIGFSIDAG